MGQITLGGGRAGPDGRSRLALAIRACEGGLYSLNSPDK